MKDGLRAASAFVMLVALSGLSPEGAGAQALKPPMPPNLFATKKLNDHLYVIAPYGPDMPLVGGNVAVCITDQGVLLVDTNYYLHWRNGQAVPMAQSIVDEVKKLTEQPIRWVVNTHHHADHVGGDPVVAKFSMVISHKNARDHIVSDYETAARNAPGAVSRAEQALAAARATNKAATSADAEDQLGQARMNLQMALTSDPLKSAPAVTYDTEMALFFGNEEIHLYHFGRAHTDGDTLVYFKTSNVIHWGDTFVNRWVPSSDPFGNSLEWVRWLDRGVAVSPTAVMVPGHGAIGTADDVMKLRQYFVDLQSRVRAVRAAGKTREQAMDDVQVPGYANYPGGAPRIRTTVAAIYDELSIKP